MDRKKLGIAGGLLLLVCIGICAGIFFQKKNIERIVAENLELGEQYLLEEDYEAAVVAFMKVIETDPKCVEAYLKVADAYVGLDDYDSAIDQLEAGYGVTGDERLKTRRDELGPKGSTEVVWTDPVLERMVRTALEIPEGTTVYVRDLDEVEWMVIYGDQYISINNDTERERMAYRYTSRTDDGPAILDAYYNSDKYSLEGAVTERGNIRDVETLRCFRGLRRVEVVANHVTDVSVLNKMQGLYSACFWANDISDLSPLERFDDPVNAEQFVEIGDILAAGTE